MAAASKTSIAEIKPLASNLDILMQDLLSDEVPAAPDFPFPDGLVAENRSGFPGLLEEPKLEKALQLLDRKYEEVLPPPIHEHSCKPPFKSQNAKKLTQMFGYHSSLPPVIFELLSLPNCQAYMFSM